LLIFLQAKKSAFKPYKAIAANHTIAFKFRRQIGVESCQIQAVSIEAMGCFVNA